MKIKERPERIAYIIGKMWAGGVESCVFNYYRAIDKTKYQFDFFYDADSTVEPPEEIIKMGARFYKLPPYQHLTKYIRELCKILKNEQYRIIHSHLNTISIFPLYAAWLGGVPIRIAHNHSVPSGSEWKRDILKNFLRCFSRVFATDYCACSEKAGRWLFGNRVFELGRVTILRNAIDFQTFYFDEDKRVSTRKELGLEDKFVVGHVGRFTYAKNHKFLIKIFAEVHKQKNNAVLLLVGDGELHEDIVKWLKKENVYENTILVGKTNKTEKYYNAMDILVFPSRFEGLPLTTVEALACGVPCVVSEAIPKEALIADGFKYMLLSASPESWARCAIEMSSKKPCLNTLSKQYEIQKAVEDLESLYAKLLNRVIKK